MMKTSIFGTGWLLVREPSACAPGIPAKIGSVWDGRFRLLEDIQDGICAAIGTESPTFRDVSNLPAAVLAGLPCIRRPGDPHAKPRLAKAFFVPPAPAAALPFMAQGSGSIAA